MAEKDSRKKSKERSWKKIFKRDREERDPSNKKARKRSQSIGARVSLFFAKTIFVRIPLLIVFVILIALVIVKAYLSPENVENLIITNFNKISYGTISLSVKKFDPYRGFVIENILIRNGEEFDNKPLVKIKKLVLNYKFFAMFAGNISIPEIGIYKPEIFLEEKKGVWNAARLMKPGKKKEEKIEEKKGAPLPEEINLPIAVKFMFNFVLDDLRLYVKSSKFNSSLEGLTYNISIDIPPFKKVPLSIKAVSLLKKMNIILNPGEKMNVSFVSKEAEVSPPLILTWNLIFSKDGAKSPKFSSFFKFGTYKTPVRFKRTYLTPLNFMVSYDLFYNPIKDYLNLNHFIIEFSGKKWIHLRGSIKNVTKKQYIDLKMAESNISLKDLYPYFRSITKNRSMIFAGDISLFPLTIKGDPVNIDVSGSLLLNKIFFSIPGTTASIPYLNYSYNVKKRSDDIYLRSLLKIPHLRYALKGSRSGDNGLELRLDVNGYNNFSRADLKNIALRFYDPAMRKDALNIAVSGNVRLKPRLSGKINIKRFTFRKEPLIAMVTDKLRKNIKSIPLKKPVNMNMWCRFSLGKTIAARLGLNLKVPDFQLNDLKLDLNALYNAKKKKASLKRLRLASKMWNFALNVSAMVDHSKAPIADSDLKINIKLNNPVMKTMYGPWQMAGLIDINTFFKGDINTGKARGAIKIVNLNVKNNPDKIEIKDFDLDFPFEAELKSFFTKIPGESQIVITKNQVIDNKFFSEKPNFSIKSIKAKHPSRDIQFEYLKDFEASMKFKNKIFQIVNMKAYILDGALYGRKILFNLADLNPDNMEFLLILDITNIDIGKLDEPDPAKKTRDAELSLSANFLGRGVNFQKELKPKGYINIYKIGEDFANKLMKGLSTEKGKSKLGTIGQLVVDNSVNIKGFDFNLDKGLVYATVSFSGKALSLIMGVENNRIKFDRMRLQEYLRNIFAQKKENQENQAEGE